MKYLILAIVTSTTLLSFAQAQSPALKLKKDKVACYGREYAEEHLDKHAKQTVKLIRVKLFEMPGYDSITMDVNLVLKKEIEFDDYVYEDFIPYRSTLSCHVESDKAIECSIDCDGGSATVKWDAAQNPDGSITFINNGFVVYGGCGEQDENGEELKSHWLDNKAGGDDIFKLYPLPKEFCEI